MSIQIPPSLGIPVRTPGARPATVRAVLVGTLALTSSYAVYLVYDGADHVSTDDAYLEGRVSAVGARVSGAVKEVLVEDNQEVKEGEVLIRLDPRDFEASLQAAVAAVEVAQGQLEAATAGVPLADGAVQGEVQLARSALRGAAAGELRRARAERLRMRKLVRDHVVAQEDLDNAEAAYRVTRAKVEGMAATLRQSKGRRGEVEVRQAELKTAAGRLAQARALQLEAEQRLDHATIRAPFNGRVTRRNVEVGQTVNVGQPLLAVVGSDELWVVANFKENELTRIRPGQRAVVRVDMVPGLALAARVDSIQAGTGARFAVMPAENASGNFVKVVQRVPVKLVLEPADGPRPFLFPGLSAVPTIDLDAPPVSAPGGTTPPAALSERHATRR
jgi:membrane fusion protein (multidrug efflux system)